jgi:cathepsin A (carboxypeptidase C)
MKVLATSLLLGAAVASPPLQQVLTAPKEDVKPASIPLQSIKDHLKAIPEDLEKLQEEFSKFSIYDNIPFLSIPKKHTRRPDSHWDHIVRGQDVQSVWVENANGEKEREIEGNLETYDLRVKKVDPGSLNIDPDVKQYSGYLDDNENDKHLFYCT